MLLLWLWLKNTRFGTAIYAVGSDPDAAAAVGVRVALVRFLVYVIAGGCYGLAGVFISAQTGSGDPLVGNPLLLSMFAAVVVGGTGSAAGAADRSARVIGAYILMIVVNILLVLNVSAYYSTIAEGADSHSRRAGRLDLAQFDAGAGNCACCARGFSAWRAGTLPRKCASDDRRLRWCGIGKQLGQSARRHAFFWSATPRSLRYALPAYICFIIVVVVTQVWLGSAILNLELLEFADRAVVLPRHPGTRPGHGDPDRRARLSVPWTIGLSGILLAGMVKGSDGR